MIEPKNPENEIGRQAKLDSYAILDTLPEEEYDEITTLASRICGMPIALISLLDDKRQWFKSHHGLDATETPKSQAFCAHAINEPNEMFIVNDSRKDERFHDNPLVTGGPNVIFYAGIPLNTEDGFSLGTLCVIDNKPNSLTEEQSNSLKLLSNQVMRLLDLRKKKAELAIKNNALNDSIRYGEKIQLSALPSTSSIAQSFQNAFVYYQPKDVIGGDIYWHFEVDQFHYLATIDCTGHGVPGALLSMTIQATLHDIVSSEKILEPKKILARLHEKVYLRLNQHEGENIQDGCDMTLCRYDAEKNELTVAAAHNPLFIFDGKKLKSLKVDRKSIGGYSLKGIPEPNRLFDQVTIPVNENHLYIMTTDGILDQLDEDDLPFSHKTFKPLLETLHQTKLSDAQILTSTFLEEWKQNAEQLDDQLLIGFQFNKH